MLELAISKHLAEMMNGVIWVERTPSLDSSFHFNISAPSANGKVSAKVSGKQSNLTG